MSYHYKIGPQTEESCFFSHKYSDLKTSNVCSNLKGIQSCCSYFRYIACFEHDEILRSQDIWFLKIDCIYVVEELQDMQDKLLASTEGDQKCVPFFLKCSG